MACFMNWLPRASATCNSQTPVSIIISFVCVAPTPTSLCPFFSPLLLTTMVLVMYSGKKRRMVGVSELATSVTVLWKLYLTAQGKPLFQYNSCYCSINTSRHLSLRLPCFNTTLVTVLLLHCSCKWRTILFQYNSCYCSIKCLSSTKKVLTSFNTTLVTVLCSTCPTSSTSSYVSIQLLLLFYHKDRFVYA